VLKLATRIAKLEAAKGALLPRGMVERHIIADRTEAARRARIASVLASAMGNVLHVFRVVDSSEPEGLTP
jgi:hypothetical protein